MKTTLMKSAVVVGVLLGAMLAPAVCLGQSDGAENTVFFGLKIKAGGRYDNVRMCVATPAGTKGGPAMDVTFYTEISLTDKVGIGIDVPVFRPVLFGAAFKMLQFEPEVSLLFKVVRGDKRDFVVGPTLGASFHYGPDYTSERSGDGKGPSFFALGPRVGAVLGLDFKRPEKAFDFQLGLNPYVTPLFGVNDPDNHKGIIIGGSLDGAFKFTP
jgi:hypothetical protein